MYENTTQDQCTAAAGIGYGSRIRGEGVMTMQAAQCAEARQTGKGALRVRVRQLRSEADRLEALAKSLPEELPPMADEALYDLIRAGC